MRNGFIKNNWVVIAGITVSIFGLLYTIGAVAPAWSLQSKTDARDQHIEIELKAAEERMTAHRPMNQRIDDLIKDHKIHESFQQQLRNEMTEVKTDVKWIKRELIRQR